MDSALSPLPTSITSPESTCSPISLLSPTPTDASRSPSPSRSATFLAVQRRQAVHRTLSVVVEYILETLDISPEETSLPKTADDLFHQLSSEPESRSDPTTYSVVLWNDEKHTREDVMVQLGDAAGLDEAEGWKMADKIHFQVGVFYFIFTSADID